MRQIVATIVAGWVLVSAGQAQTLAPILTSDRPTPPTQSRSAPHSDITLSLCASTHRLQNVLGASLILIRGFR